MSMNSEKTAPLMALSPLLLPIRGFGDETGR
jgi:hypothetical protein